MIDFFGIPGTRFTLAVSGETMMDRGVGMALTLTVNGVTTYFDPGNPKQLEDFFTKIELARKMIDEENNDRKL